MNTISLPKKRLLFITYGFPPNAQAGTHRSLRFVRYLRKLNWEVIVLTADPEDYVPGTPVDKQFLKRVPWDLEVIHSPVFRGLVKVIRFQKFFKKIILQSPQNTQSSSSLPKKGRIASGPFEILKDFISTPFTIPDNHIGWLWGSLLHGWLALRRRPFDLVYSSGPPWTSHLIGFFLSRLRDIPWVADFRDPWARSPWRWKRNIAQKFMAEYLEHIVVRQARFIILNTDWMKKEFQQFYKDIDSEKFQLIPNGYEPEDFEDIEQPFLSRGNRFQLVHAGSIYGGRDPIPLLKAWALAVQCLTPSKETLLLSLVGVSEYQKKELIEIIRKLDLEKHVQLVPRVSHRESLKIMAGANLLLLLQGGLSLCVPAKLFEYMALCKPILGLTPAGAAADILELYPLGRIVDPNDPNKILEGILSFFEERNNVYPREKICEFMNRYKAFGLTKKLDDLLNRAMVQSRF